MKWGLCFDLNCCSICWVSLWMPRTICPRTHIEDERTRAEPSIKKDLPSQDSFSSTSIQSIAFFLQHQFTCNSLGIATTSWVDVYIYPLIPDIFIKPNLRVFVWTSVIRQKEEYRMICKFLSSIDVNEHLVTVGLAEQLMAGCLGLAWLLAGCTPFASLLKTL